MCDRSKFVFDRDFTNVYQRPGNFSEIDAKKVDVLGRDLKDIGPLLQADQILTERWPRLVIDVDIDP